MLEEILEHTHNQLHKERTINMLALEKIAKLENEVRQERECAQKRHETLVTMQHQIINILLGNSKPEEKVEQVKRHLEIVK
jgi:hypothetical protein